MNRASMQADDSGGRRWSSADPCTALLKLYFEKGDLQPSHVGWCCVQWEECDSRLQWPKFGTNINAIAPMEDARKTLY